MMAAAASNPAERDVGLRCCRKVSRNARRSSCRGRSLSDRSVDAASSRLIAASAVRFALSPMTALSGVRDALSSMLTPPAEVGHEVTSSMLTAPSEMRGRLSSMLAAPPEARDWVTPLLTASSGLTKRASTLPVPADLANSTWRSSARIRSSDSASDSGTCAVTRSSSGTTLTLPFPSLPSSDPIPCSRGTSVRTPASGASNAAPH